MSGLLNSTTGKEMEDNSRAVMKSLQFCCVLIPAGKGLSSLTQYLSCCLCPLLETLYWCCKWITPPLPHQYNNGKYAGTYLNAKFNQFLLIWKTKKKLIILCILPFASECNLFPMLFHLSSDYFDYLKSQQLKRLFSLVTSLLLSTLCMPAWQYTFLGSVC